MARSLNGTDQTLGGTLPAAQGLSTGLSIGGWARYAQQKNTVLMTLCDGTASNQYSLWSDTNGAFYIATTAGGSASDLSAGTNTIGLNTWRHFFATWVSATERRLYINGAQAAGGTGLPSRNPGQRSDFRLSNNGDGNSTLRFNGLLGEWGVWDMALTAAEIAALGKGVSPLRIRPARLTHYWPLFGRRSPEPDLMGGIDLTLNNGPTQAAHPRLLTPAGWRYPQRNGAMSIAVLPGLGALSLSAAAPSVRAVDNPRIGVGPAAVTLQAQAPRAILVNSNTAPNPPPTDWQTDTGGADGDWRKDITTARLWQTEIPQPKSWRSDE